VDAFFKDAPSPELRAFVREMISDYQKFTHELGLLDVYNQGMMSRLNAGCWSDGYRALYSAVKQAVDPKRILNPGLWLDRPPETGV
jgi:FAD/FMN-containing dehydrogenase